MKKQTMKPISNRETELLYWLSNGCTMKEIAVEMSISPRTVESYINSIKTKTQLNRRSQLVHFFQSSVVKRNNMFASSVLQARI